jgi:hypothetical protein
VIQTNSKIVNYYTYNQVDKLTQLHTHLVLERMKLDKFMSMFLDKFERKMSYEDTDTPIWDLYRKKSDEYSKLSQLINTANYYLSKK